MRHQVKPCYQNIRITTHFPRDFHALSPNPTSPPLPPPHLYIIVNPAMAQACPRDQQLQEAKPCTVSWDMIPPVLL